MAVCRCIGSLAHSCQERQRSLSVLASQCIASTVSRTDRRVTLTTSLVSEYGSVSTAHQHN